MELFFFWIVMAVIVGMIAGSKGYGGVGWGFYGLLIWPIALVHILLKPSLAHRVQQHSVDTACNIDPNGPANAVPPASASAELHQLTFAVADEWRRAGRTFDMRDARDEALLRLAEAKHRAETTVPRSTVGVQPEIKPAVETEEDRVRAWFKKAYGREISIEMVRRLILAQSEGRLLTEAEAIRAELVAVDRRNSI